MDYKEKLKEALNADKTPDGVRGWIRISFPELAESEDERIYNLIYSSIKNDMSIGSPKNKELALAWLEKRKELIEWKEIDEEMIDAIDESLYMFEGGRSQEVVTQVERERDWLKSLRPQPKQEWTERDDEMYNRVIKRYTWMEGYAIRAYGENEAKRVTNECCEEELWIQNRVKDTTCKSLWRPSEEQLCALRETIEHLRLFRPEATKTIAELKELDDNLKKL